MTQDGHLYVGYPVVSAGEANKTFDALFLIRNKGIVIIDLEEGAEIESNINKQDNLYGILDS